MQSIRLGRYWCQLMPQYAQRPILLLQLQQFKILLLVNLEDCLTADTILSRGLEMPITVVVCEAIGKG